MAYRVRVEPRANRVLASLGLSDPVLGIVYVRLHQDLASLGTHALTRTTDPFDGMTFSFSLIDPDNRMVQHHFRFHVMIGTDEETLLVVNAAHIRSVNF